MTEQLIDQMARQRQHLLGTGVSITGVRIHPDDLQAVEATDANSYVLDVMDATLFGVPYLETTEIAAGSPEFTTDAGRG